SFRLNGVVEISDKQVVLLSSDAVVFRQECTAILESMREELDDHRLAINENTDELAATNEFMNDMSRKLDKLAERVDELALLVKGVKDDKKFDFQPLTGKEKQVFQALYVLTESQPYASYEQVARKVLLEKSAVINAVTSMIQKGVPVLKRYDGNTAFLKLDAGFRILQARKNIVKIDSLLSWVR
ncbi:hypothetical protein KY309_01100, partial [Candidatus Woesearchaeota archaeon]|nr:hypothetical protein [Candidatus Woesearchaeota archaeon]